MEENDWEKMIRDWEKKIRKKIEKIIFDPKKWNDRREIEKAIRLAEQLPPSVWKFDVLEELRERDRILLLKEWAREDKEYIKSLKSSK